MKSVVIAGAVAMLFCAGAHAQGPRADEAPLPPSIFSNLVQEEDVALAFGYLRESLDAALAGREPPPPDALRRRAEVIGEELKRRGASTARSVLDAIEAILRERVTEPPRLPPSSPLQKTGVGI
ncbi:MAG: hypothetical protein ACXW2A_03175 [Burkholderiales bacterium]